MSTNTALDQIKNRVEGHSATPWQVEPYLHSMYDRVRVTSPDDGPDFNTAEDVLPADAELIAAAPKLLAALEAIQVMHRKVPVYVIPAGDCEHGADCESVEIDGESMCPDETEGYTCDHCAELNPDEYPDYPCSTIKAIEEALR